ncbi:DNA-binding protein HB1 [Microlunatus endophyticus]|uniref:DNA-binding protein HB1 n=1 Tax=Microlunatus endophyticus TaxID=1716077 RepID=A0A917W146_9ACTN|nr:HU family DNA-binding protein [Microlunatus endophyticus]GGL56117.1 DNA-binding protein HB1 [Microlunatus endophyticus]
MNRSDLARAIASRTGTDRATVDSILDALAEELISLVGASGELRWPGMLTVDVVDRAARTGRSPRTGKPLEIPASRTVRVRPGSRLKSAAR